MGVVDLCDDVVFVGVPGGEVEEVVGKRAWKTSQCDGAKMPRSHDEGTEHHAERASLWYACGSLVRFAKALGERVVYMYIF